MKHDWPGPSIKPVTCKREGCDRTRELKCDARGEPTSQWLYKGGGFVDGSTAYECTGKVKPKPAPEKASTGRHAWSRKADQGVKYCVRDGCSARYDSWRRDVNGKHYLKHNATAWGKVAGVCKGKT